MKINPPFTINVPSSFALAAESATSAHERNSFHVGDLPVHAGEALIGFGALALVLLLAIAIVIARSGRRGAELAMAQAIRADELEERLSEMLRAQSEATGRVDAMGQALAGRQAEMARAVNERLDSVTHRVGQSMEATTRNTMDSLRVLHERLGIIDNAHKNLTDLTSQVTTLRDVLANKQSRGAFGQARMEAIVQDGMPKGSYEFQYTLSTGKRPDCVVFLPDQRPLCIDAKFPLEAMTALHDARSDEEKQIRHAAAAQRRDEACQRHRREIPDRRRDPGHRADVRAVGIGLCRNPRRFRRRDPEGLSRPRRAGVAVAVDAGDPGDAADPERRADARRRRPDPHRSAQPRRRPRPPARARAEAAEAFWRRQRGRPADPDLRRQDRKARRADRGTRFQQDRRAGGSAAPRHRRGAPELFPCRASCRRGSSTRSIRRSEHPRAVDRPA